jgi:LPPG:FO 2-phospho-L-lactate transferase
MRRLGAPAWFQLGDRDLATHLRRTELLGEGRTLSEVTSEIAHKLGVKTRILPMADGRVETRVLTADGELSFQEYFVRERYQVAAHEVRFNGAERAQPAPGVLETIAHAEAIVIAPSNPITSIGPILAVPGILQALKETKAPVVAISPIIGDAAVSGPAGELMQAQGLPVSIAGVVCCYADFLDVLIADERDAALGAQVEGIGVRYVRTLMRSEADKMALARSVLGFLRERPVEAAAS